MWYFTEIKLDNDVSKEKANWLQCLLQHIDYDCPNFYENGIYGNWRKPHYPIEDIMGLLHRLGHPCKGRSVDEEYSDRLDYQSWKLSNPKNCPQDDTILRDIVVFDDTILVLIFDPDILEKNKYLIKKYINDFNETKNYKVI